jgi:hypothetical protein
VPATVKLGVGVPEAIMLKEPAVPVAKVAVLADVIAGAVPTPRVNDCVTDDAVFVAVRTTV